MKVLIFLSLFLSYVTMSKFLLLMRGLHTLTGAYLTKDLRDPVKRVVHTLCKEMDTRFRRIEQNGLYHQASALDPRFKQKVFKKPEDAERTFGHLCNMAARVTLPNQHAEEEEDEEEQRSFAQESSVWREFDEDNTGLQSTRNPTADAVMEVCAFRTEARIPRHSNPLTWWGQRKVSYPQLTKVMKTRLCIVATSVPSERVFSKTGQLISERRNRLSLDKVSQLVFLNFNLK